MRRRYCPGGNPAQRRNALLKETSDSYPTSLAISGSASLERASMPAATCMRRAVTYSMTLEPTRARKRCAKPVRERATALARDATVHASPGRPCTSESARDLRVREPAEPAATVRRQARDVITYCLHEDDVGHPFGNGLEARPPGETERTFEPSRPAPHPPADMNEGRKRFEERIATSIAEREDARDGPRE